MNIAILLHASDCFGQPARLDGETDFAVVHMRGRSLIFLSLCRLGPEGLYANQSLLWPESLNYSTDMFV